MTALVVITMLTAFAPIAGLWGESITHTACVLIAATPEAIIFQTVHVPHVEGWDDLPSNIMRIGVSYLQNRLLQKS